MELLFSSIGRSAGLFLLLSVISNLIGVIMFWIRGGQRGGRPPTPVYFMWERYSIMAAIVLAAVGFVLLDGLLENTPGHVLARAGAAAYLIAGALGVTAEALGLSGDGQGSYPYPLIVAYVVLAYLSQAVIGGALLLSGSLAAWAGWAMIIWNLACVVILPVVSRRDIYFPALHHFMPLLIGIALLSAAS